MAIKLAHYVGGGIVAEVLEVVESIYYGKIYIVANPESDTLQAWMEEEVENITESD